MDEEEQVYESVGPATKEDLFFCQWGEETLKQSAPSLQDSLQKLITLDAALIGGSLLALKEDIVPLTFRLLTVICFLISLALALLGTQPIWRNVTMNCPAEIRDYEFDTIRHKSFWLRIAYIFLMIGFSCAIVGIMAKSAINPSM